MTLSRLNVTPDLVAPIPAGRAACLPFSGTPKTRCCKTCGEGHPSGVRALERQPGMGRPVENMDDEFRDWIIDFGDTDYVARYRVDQQSAIILAVRHRRETGF